jgi:hypothetical protein
MRLAFLGAIPFVDSKVSLQVLLQASIQASIQASLGARHGFIERENLFGHRR